MDYNYFQKGYILREETLHFACTAYNMIHPDRQIEIPARYQRPQYDTSSTVDTPGPMDDEPPVPPQRATIPDYPRWEPGYAPVQPSYAYPCGYGPPGSQGPSRLFAAAISSDGAGPSDVPPGTPLNRLANRNHQAAHHRAGRHRLDHIGGCRPGIRHHPDRQTRRLHGFLMQPI